MPTKATPAPFTRGAFWRAYAAELLTVPPVSAWTALPGLVRAARMLAGGAGGSDGLYLRSNPCAMRAARKFGIRTDRDFRAAWDASPEDAELAHASAAALEMQRTRYSVTGAFLGDGARDRGAV